MSTSNGIDITVNNRIYSNMAEFICYNAIMHGESRRFTFTNKEELIEKYNALPNIEKLTDNIKLRIMDSKIAWLILESQENGFKVLGIIKNYKKIKNLK